VPADLSIYRFIGLSAQCREFPRIVRLLVYPFIGARRWPVYRFIGLSAQAGADLSVYRFIGLSAQAGKTGRATTLYIEANLL